MLKRALSFVFALVVTGASFVAFQFAMWLYITALPRRYFDEPRLAVAYAWPSQASGLCAVAGACPLGLSWSALRHFWPYAYTTTSSIMDCSTIGFETVVRMGGYFGGFLSRRKTLSLLFPSMCCAMSACLRMSGSSG
jgi:hypothetical protein